MAHATPRRHRIAGMATVLSVLMSCIAFEATPQDVVGRGRATYLKVGCYACHGTRGAGGGEAGPAIAPNPVPSEAFLLQLRRPVRDMPAYPARLLSDEDAADIYAYLKSIVPGKPPADIAALNR